jgi:arylsulfatase A-like enzyme
MNVVWLILDSLSFGSTPFAEDGPNTTPNLKELAGSEGVTFTEAYAPGPLSPSSHAAMFTGELPSAAGMHEAHPYFDGGIPTIADALRRTHETHLLSLNMWLFQGLDSGFDSTKDFSRQYLLFREATDPLNYFRKHDPDGSGIRRLLRFATTDGKPVRSLLNYANYKRLNGSLVPERWGDSENYQYAEQINNELRSIVDTNDQDKFVFANYMDIHPPFDASDQALEQFAPGMSRDELPIGIPPERHITNDEKSYDPDAMEKLYHAAVWDFDRKLGPTLRDLIDDDTMVIVTSDHGIWNCDTAYSENRLHVPLVIFAPDEPPRTVDHTVNLRSLPRTIIEYVTGESGGFDGQSLLDVTSDEISVTEILHHPNEVYEKTGRVDVTKRIHTDKQIQRDLVLIEGDARVEYIDGTWNTVAGDDSASANLRSYGERILSQDVRQGETDIEYDAVTEERLEDLGYM